MSPYAVVFAGPKEERIARELGNEKREEIGQQLHQALHRVHCWHQSPPSSPNEIQTLVEPCRGAPCRLWMASAVRYFVHSNRK
jgi:hypothetical protein